MRHLAAVLAFAGTAAHFSAALAAGIAVSPVSLQFTGGQRAAAITLRNSAAQPVVVQAEVQRWTRDGGADVYQPDPAIVATPPLLRLEPGAEQVVRVGFPNGAPLPGAQERAYRVWFREVAPDPSRTPAAAAGQVQLLLRIGVPLFVAPQAAKREAQWQAAAAGDHVQLRLTNTGNVRLRLHRFQLRPSRDSTQTLGELQALIYVFPGETRAVDIPVAAPLKAGQSVMAIAESEDGSLSNDLRLAGE